MRLRNTRSSKETNQARPVGIAVGRGGRVFVTSLYLGGNVVSPHCVSDLVMITRADDSPEHPFEAYDIATIGADKLWSDLSSPSWERRSRAHQELLRRGQPLLDEAASRLEQLADDDPAMFHLPWLAGAGGSEGARKKLLELTAHDRGELRQLAFRVLAEFPRLNPPGGRFVEALADADPRVQLAALDFLFDSPEPLPLAAVLRLACSSDTYLRQTATRLLAAKASVSQLKHLFDSSDKATRQAGVLAAGIRLTVPPVHEPPPAELPLFYPKGNAFFHAQLHFADIAEPVELSKLGRIGSYTIAQRWKALPLTAAQKHLLELLAGALNDSQPAVQLQAAYYLGLLNDPNLEPRVAEVRQDVERKKLSTAPLQIVERLWEIGPFADGDEGFQRAHPPEQGAVDLAAVYTSEKRQLAWKVVNGAAGPFDFADAELSGASCYLYCQLQSIHRQPARLMLRGSPTVKLWHNGRVSTSVAAADDTHEWLLDVQPGSNDILARVPASQAQDLRLNYQAAEAVAAVLPEKLDASLLASRLKQGLGAETIGPEFLDADWSRAAGEGDAARGRKLFGTLGCVKCHAIVPDQKGGGARAWRRSSGDLPFLTWSNPCWRRADRWPSRSAAP